MKKNILAILIFLTVLGIGDAGYLTYEHYADIIPPCTSEVFLFVDCGKVLRSSYAMIWGIPLAVMGVVQYTSMAIWLIGSTRKQKWFGRLAVLQSTLGFGFSLYFVYLQLVVIKSICLYCMVSAVISTVIFFLTQWLFSEERKKMTIWIMGIGYKRILKNIFFKFDPEIIHIKMVSFGETLGSLNISRAIVRYFVQTDLPSVSQTIEQIRFAYPVGLAAGFDYEARLTKSLAPWGFGFQTVGTITNKPYNGNPPPMLGRLPKSKSLMVNKGFKNPGAEQVVKKLAPISFDIPVGISVGRTNSRDLVSQKESVDDIITAFKKFEDSQVKHAYYELNISCPNLYGDVEFYSSKNLEQLLKAVDKLKLTRPVFVKMPIDKSEKETLQMLKVIALHSPTGVIFGNLQKNRQHPALDPEEVAKFKTGNFSGKATFEDSNRLISLAYKNFKKRFVIVGCGGVFSAQDAYLKIKLGATLIQLITGMIYQGPQTVMEINYGLKELLKKDGYKNIGEAVGVQSK